MNHDLTAEQSDLVAMVSGLSRRHAADRRGSLDRDLLTTFAAQELGGMALPTEVGGGGGTLFEAVLAIEAAGRVAPAAGDALHVLNFGAVRQLAAFAANDVQRHYLAEILAGEKLVAIAMTEPEAGSAVTELRCKARLDGEHATITGQKIFTTNAELADLFVVWARFGDGSRDAGSVLVKRDAPGFTVDTTHRWISGEPYGVLFLDDCRVPRQNVLLDSDGFAKMLNIFNIERLGNASRALATGQAALDIAVEHAQERRQFGRRLVEFQGLQWKFAEMSLRLEAARMLLYHAARSSDSGSLSGSDAALAKLACNRAGFEVTNTAIAILGGRGLEEDSDLGHLLLRARGWQIAGGTEEQLLNRIAAGVLGESFPQRPAKVG
jgi:alkylation response protein AidB-like acyl-CoA dehydrogenase